jgi:hypothetical protein
MEGNLMLDMMLSFFRSGFVFPGITAEGLMWGIGLGIIFGAIWLSGYWPPLFRKYWLWCVMVFSAFFSWAAIAFVQIPLQGYTGLALGKFWSEAVLMKWLFLAGIPQILLSGLVQEGAKMVPVVIWWWRNNRDLSPGMGIAVGAVAGAGLGIFEAVWAHNQVFAAGWTLQLVSARGAIALLPFVERFFTVPLHIGVSALVGYGLARGWAWQFYLIASFLHALTNYSVVLLRTGALTTVQLEIYAAVISMAVTGVALWLRWKETEELY